MLEKSLRKYVIRDLWNRIMGIRQRVENEHAYADCPFLENLKKAVERIISFRVLNWNYDDWPDYYSVWKHRWNLNYRMVRCIS